MLTAPISRRATMMGLWADNRRDPCAFAADSLYDAAMAGDLVAARALLAAHADLAEEGELGTALHVAALKDDAAIATLLLDQGADIEASTLDKAQRPLHVAAEHGSGAVARLLWRAARSSK